MSVQHISLKIYVRNLCEKRDLCRETCSVQRALDLPTLTLLVERGRQALNNYAYKGM